MSTPPIDIFEEHVDEAFEALVSKGIHAILFPVIRGTGGKPTVDKSKNLLHGVPVGNITSGGMSVDSEEFQDQLRGGMYKQKISGAIDAGDISFDGMFNPNKGMPKIEGVVNSMSMTPQFVLLLAKKKSEEVLEGFFSAGVNFGGGKDIKGDFGKAIKTSLKFNITGEPKFGYAEVGEISMSVYKAGAGS